MERLTEDDKDREVSRLAELALTAQEKAVNLAQAAVAAGDPEERQKLLNAALQAEIEAESFGKTAKWLSSGSVQGLLAGAGIGAVPGISLGVVTGTIVGGLTTLITGSLGGAIGALVGAMHGPFFKLGNIGGEVLSSILPTIPGWHSSEQQRRALESLLGQIKSQDQPHRNDLQSMAKANVQRVKKPRKLERRSMEKSSASKTRSTSGAVPNPRLFDTCSH